MVLAGKGYGTGSSRDWAAKVTSLLGVRVVLAQSFERIHRSNLVGMGVLPLQFEAGQGPDTLGLTGTKTFTVTGLTGCAAVPGTLTVHATPFDGSAPVVFTVDVRLDTPGEHAYYRHGGVLPYVLPHVLDAHHELDAPDPTLPRPMTSSVR